MKEKKTVFLRKVGGFYHAFDEDAIVLFYLFHYKINNGKSGFPVGSIEKVKNVLEKEKVNYFLKVDDEEEESRDFARENRYMEIYEQGEFAYRSYHKKEKLIARIFCLEEEQVDKVILYVQDLI